MRYQTIRLKINCSAYLRNDYIHQVLESKNIGNKSKTEKRQGDQRHREALKRRKSLPRQTESYATPGAPTKPISAPTLILQSSNPISILPEITSGLSEKEVNGSELIQV